MSDANVNQSETNSQVSAPPVNDVGESIDTSIPAEAMGPAFMPETLPDNAATGQEETSSQVSEGDKSKPKERKSDFWTKKLAEDKRNREESKTLKEQNAKLQADLKSKENLKDAATIKKMLLDNPKQGFFKELGLSRAEATQMYTALTSGFLSDFKDEVPEPDEKEITKSKLSELEKKVLEQETARQKEKDDFVAKQALEQENKIVSDFNTEMTEFVKTNENWKFMNKYPDRAVKIAAHLVFSYAKDPVLSQVELTPEKIGNLVENYLMEEALEKIKEADEYRTLTESKSSKNSQSQPTENKKKAIPVPNNSMQGKVSSRIQPDDELDMSEEARFKRAAASLGV